MLNLLYILAYNYRRQEPAITYYQYYDGYIGKLNVCCIYLLNILQKIKLFLFFFLNSYSQFSLQDAVSLIYL